LRLILASSTPNEEDGEMGLFDNLKDVLGGERDEHAEPATASAAAEPRHVDRDAPEESPYGPQITGGKHVARD